MLIDTMFSGGLMVECSASLGLCRPPKAHLQNVQSSKVRLHNSIARFSMFPPGKRKDDHRLGVNSHC